MRSLHPEPVFGARLDLMPTIKISATRPESSSANQRERPQTPYVWAAIEYLTGVVEKQEKEINRLKSKRSSTGGLAALPDSAV